MSTEQKPTIKTADVLTKLNEGKTREEIGAEYGLNKLQTKRLFMHPELKGKKVKTSVKAAPFAIEGLDGSVIDAPAFKPNKTTAPKKVAEAAQTEATEATEVTPEVTPTPEASQADAQGSQGSESW